MKFNYPNKTRNDFLKDVVTLLIARRIELGVTQDDLNHMLGVADRLVSKWECGIRTPTSFHLYCWADALESMITVTANDNSPPSISDEMEKAVNDNILFNVHHSKEE
ncbi:helix-turn-helix domain-containing protein [Psychroserpens sp.]